MGRTPSHGDAPNSKPNCHQNCHSENAEWWMVRDGTEDANNSRLLTKDILRHRIALHPLTGCWLYQGANDRVGYGRVFLPGGKERKAPKLFFEVFVGPVPNGARLIHALAPKDCIGAGCCNPAHLQIEQSFRGVRFARRICPKGHLIDADNAVIEQRGDNLLVRCRECRRATWRSEKRRAGTRARAHSGSTRTSYPPVPRRQT